jgi:hypothetical protein
LKLNLAALPKEEAWRIFIAAFELGSLATAIHADGVEITDPNRLLGAWSLNVSLNGRISEKRGAEYVRPLFERWYAREIGAGS